MATTTAADLTAGQIAMVGEARLTWQHKAVCTNLFVRRQLAKGEKSYFVPKYGNVTASDLTDGVDMTASQQLAITGTTHVTDEAGVKVVVTKKLRSQMKDDVYRTTGVIIGNAIAKKIDLDGLALFSGLSSGLGSAGTALTLGHVAAAVAQLKGQSEPVPEPYVYVGHPYQINYFVDAIATPGTSNMPPELQKDLLLSYWAGNMKLYNVPIFQDGNITIDSADDAYGAVFGRMCFLYIVGWEPENWVEYDGSLRGWELGIVADYAMVEEDDAYGRYMLFDSVAPTA